MGEGGMIKTSHVKPFDTLEDHCILGIDPGKATGIALWIPSIFPYDIYDSAELALAEIRPWVAQRMASAPHIRLCMIACEHFAQARGGRPLSNQPDALRVTELARQLADEYCCSFTTNSASASKKLANNERMRKIGWYRYTKNGHDTDGRRQVLSTVARFHPEMFKAILDKEKDHDATR